MTSDYCILVKYIVVVKSSPRTLDLKENEMRINLTFVLVVCWIPFKTVIWQRITKFRYQIWLVGSISSRAHVPLGQHRVLRVDQEECGLWERDCAGLCSCAHAHKVYFRIQYISKVFSKGISQTQELCITNYEPTQILYLVRWASHLRNPVKH